MTVKLVASVVVCLLGWVYIALIPPPPKAVGTPGGPAVTSLRVRLSDGRHLSYKEAGVPKEIAKHKIIMVHGIGGSKNFILPISQEIIDKLQIYLLTYDRAGYGESDANPKRTVKSEAYDIQELADGLQLGTKFYVIGISMGGYTAWSCLKYIPQRLSGASLVVPVVNYWWPSVPTSVSREAFSTQLLQDKWTYSVAHYTPWLLNWWMTQKWFPSFSVLDYNVAVFSKSDLEIMKNLSNDLGTEQPRQGEYVSVVLDMMIGVGKWEFDPTDVTNPFPNNQGSVSIWQGMEDKIVPYQLNRHVSQKLPWIRYHELSNEGHLFVFKRNFADAIITGLIGGSTTTAA